MPENPTETGRPDMTAGAVPPLQLADRSINAALPAFIMGIVNATPDSFWHQSRHGLATDGARDIAEAVESALAMAENGADIIDIGGESSRPGAQYVSASEETDRIVPLIEGIRKYSRCPVSVDTRKKSVMQAAFRAGADILNDISALEDDPALAGFAAEKKIPVVLMHKRGEPATMQRNGVYDDPVRDVSRYLAGRAAYAVSAGIAPEKIIYDAGIGFGKNLAANCALIGAGAAVGNAAAPAGVRPHVIMALSRKTCIGEMTGKTVEARLAGTLAANLLAVQAGATILRVHDVPETADMLKVLACIASSREV